jgi:hypothetical protein
MTEETELAVPAGLPAELTSMAQGMVQAVAAMGNTEGGQYAKLDSNTGAIIYGVDDTEVEEGSEWAVDPTSFEHGWVAWGDKSHGNAGKHLGEVLVSVRQPLPSRDDLDVVQSDNGWQEVVSLRLQCVSGEDVDTVVIFKTNSHGGKQNHANIMKQVVVKITEGDLACVPVVSLASSSYIHKAYGTIHKPEFTVVRWTTMDDPGEPDPKPEPEPEPEPELPIAAEEPAPRRRRRKAA